MNKKIITCRLCWASSPKYYSLFENDLSNMLEALTSIKITPNDKPSTCICYNCYQDLRIAYSVQQKFCNNEAKHQGELLVDFLIDNHDELVKVLQHEMKNVSVSAISHETFDKFSSMIEPSTIVRYTCKICSEMFELHNELLKHLEKHIATDNAVEKVVVEESILCEHCGEIFTSSDAYDEHQNTHNMDSSHKCKVCGLYHTTLDELKEHIKQNHTKTKPFLCDECFQQFGVFYVYKLHKDKHIRGYAYMCNICNIEFDHKVNLEFHQETKHPETSDADDTNAEYNKQY